MVTSLEQQFIDQISTCHNIVIKICRMYGLNLEDRNDLKQDILLNAWIAFPQFRGDSKIINLALSGRAEYYD